MKYNLTSDYEPMIISEKGYILYPYKEVEELHIINKKLSNKMEVLSKTLGVPNKNTTIVIPKNLKELEINELCILLNRLHGENVHMGRKLERIYNIMGEHTHIKNLSNCYI